MKIHQVGLRFVPCGYVTNLLIAFRNFTDAPKMTLQLHVGTSNIKTSCSSSLKKMDGFPLTRFKFMHTAERTRNFIYVTSANKNW